MLCILDDHISSELLGEEADIDCNQVMIYVEGEEELPVIESLGDLRNLASIELVFFFSL